MCVRATIPPFVGCRSTLTAHQYANSKVRTVVRSWSYAQQLQKCNFATPNAMTRGLIASIIKQCLFYSARQVSSPVNSEGIQTWIPWPSLKIEIIKIDQQVNQYWSNWPTYGYQKQVWGWGSTELSGPNNICFIARHICPSVWRQVHTPSVTSKKSSVTK